MNVGLRALNTANIKNNAFNFKGAKFASVQGDTLEIRGSETSAKIYKSEITKETAKEIQNYCNSPFFKNAKIAIMPDAEGYNGSIVGLSAKVLPQNLKNISPSVLGNDIGCGVLVAETDAKAKDVDLEELDKFIKFELFTNKQFRKLPSGDLLEGLKVICKETGSDISEIEDSFCTLGNGNHFIELDKDENDNVYLAIHTGSRKLGFFIADFYQKLQENFATQQKTPKMSYIEAVKIAQEFAKSNRTAIAREILKKIKTGANSYMDCPHNYIQGNNTIHKGSIDASLGKKVAIPLNMRDGIILGVGKGNTEWNCSAPHGSGRKLSRSEAKHKIDFEIYKNSMANVFSTSVSPKSIDEAPQAYNDSKETIDRVAQTINVSKVIHPIYNYKKK